MELAERLQSPGLRGMTPELSDAVARRVFDTLGALFAGRKVRESVVIAGLLSGRDRPTSAVEEVRELCASVRSSEVDDIDRASCTTPGSVAVPVALALGAERAVSGQVLMAAVVAGYEAMVSLGDAVGGAHVLAKGVWPSYLAAPFAAAASAARLLELDAERTAHALAIAVTRSTGVVGRISAQPSSRWFTYGCAAADGVLAALAAEAGMAGDLGALERALPAGTAAGFDGERFAPDEKGWRMERVDSKPFCTSRQALSAIQAADLAHEALGRAPLDLIEVAVPAAYRAMLDQPAPTDRLASITSAQFQVAAALARPQLLFDVARDQVEPPDDVRELMRVTSVVEDPELTAMYPAVWPGRVRMRSTGGEEATRLVCQPAGAGERPLDWDALGEKHTSLAAWGEGLPHGLALCRGLAAQASSVAASALLDLTSDLRSKEVYA